MAGEDNNEKDCLGCRLVSGFGLLAIGFYIYTQSKRRGKFEANTMRVLSASMAFLGVARLANASFLVAKKEDEK